MAKVSVGLRGWRFDEEEIFTDDEELKPLDGSPRSHGSASSGSSVSSRSPAMSVTSNTARPRSTAL